jgi:acid phosphatase (class A)
MPDIEALTEKLMKDPDFQPKVGKTKLETATEEATQRVNQHRKNAAALSLAVEKKTAIETLSEHAEKQKELKEIDEMLFGVPSEDDREAMERELDIIELNVDTDIKLVSPPKNTSSQVKEELKTIIDLHLQTKEETENFEFDIAKPAKVQDLDILKSFLLLAEDLGLSDEITRENLRPILKDTRMIVMNLKYKFNRPRPFQLMDFHNVEFEPADFKSSKTPAYPSGHSFQGTLIAMILSQIFPLYSEKFMKLGESIGDNRVIFGVHYPSDNYAGIELAKQVYPFVNFDKLGFQAIPQESEPLETEEKSIEKHSEEHHTIEHDKEDKPFSMDDAKQSINDQLEQIKNKLETGDYDIEKSDMPLEKATGVEIAATGAALAAGGIALWDLYQTFKNNKKLTRDQRIELDEALEANEEEIKDIKVNFNEDQELPDLENTDNIAEIVEAAKDPEKAEDVVQKVRKKRWDAGKTAEERQKIREERDKKREGRETTPLAPIGELTPELDVDSVLRQAEESGLMDHIHEQIEGHGKDNPFHTKEDTVKSIKAKHKTPEKMKEYLGKQHGKFETFKAKAKQQKEKDDQKTAENQQKNEANSAKWDIDENVSSEDAAKSIREMLHHQEKYGGKGQMSSGQRAHIKEQIDEAKARLSPDDTEKLAREIQDHNDEKKKPKSEQDSSKTFGSSDYEQNVLGQTPEKEDEPEEDKEYEGKDIPPERRVYGDPPEDTNVKTYQGPEGGSFYDRDEAESKEAGDDGATGAKGEDGKAVPPPVRDGDKVSQDTPVGQKAEQWGKGKEGFIARFLAAEKAGYEAKKKEDKKGDLKDIFRRDIKDASYRKKFSRPTNLFYS